MVFRCVPSPVAFWLYITVTSGAGGRVVVGRESPSRLPPGASMSRMRQERSMKNSTRLLSSQTGSTVPCVAPRIDQVLAAPVRSDVTSRPTLGAQAGFWPKHGPRPAATFAPSGDTAGLPAAYLDAIS